MKFIKRFIKYYLPTLIFIGALGILFLVYMIKNHKPIVIFTLGHGEKIHTNTIAAIVKEDGVELPSAKVFLLENRNQLLVYIPDSKKSFGTIIVDKNKNNIGLTSGYDVLLGRYLFETDESGFVYAKSPKWELDPKLNITENKIIYTTERLEDKEYIHVNYEIILKGE